MLLNLTFFIALSFYHSSKKNCDLRHTEFSFNKKKCKMNNSPKDHNKHKFKMWKRRKETNFSLSTLYFNKICCSLSPLVWQTLANADKSGVLNQKPWTNTYCTLYLPCWVIMPYFEVGEVIRFDRYSIFTNNFIAHSNISFNAQFSALKRRILRKAW